MNIPNDKASPKERMAAFAKGETLDRIPCVPLLGQNCAPLYGYSVRQFNTSADVMADVARKVFQEFRPDSISIGTGLQGMPEALGAALDFPEMSAPKMAAPGFTEYAELDDMEPADPYKSGRLPIFLEALEKLKKAVGDEVPVGTGFGGPLTAALLFSGTDRALRDIRRKPEAMHKVLELVTASLMRFIDAAVDIGLGLSVSEPLCSSTVIRPQFFEIFAQPYLKRLVDYTREKHQKTLGIHICGRSKAIWPQVADTGLTSFSIDNIEDVGEARETIGHRMTVMGNVSPVSTLFDGSVEDVYREAKMCIEKGKGSLKGYILSSGCEIPVATPRENIMALMDAARMYG
jgi:uroporphyrinogen decarboxylase